MQTRTVVTHRRCNQACGHCVARAPADDPAFASTAAVLGRIAEALAGAPTEIVLTGGEPTMRKDLTALVRAVRHGGARAVLETNGTLLDANAVRALVEGRALARAGEPLSRRRLARRDHPRSGRLRGHAPRPRGAPRRARRGRDRGRHHGAEPRRDRCRARARGRPVLGQERAPVAARAVRAREPRRVARGRSPTLRRGARHARAGGRARGPPGSPRAGRAGAAVPLAARDPRDARGSRPRDLGDAWGERARVAPAPRAVQRV
jgi:hypothetical protein